MEKAVECFRRAYEGSRSKDALIAYLLAFGVTKTSEEYQNLVRRLGVEKEVLKEIKEKLAEFGKKPEIPTDYENIDETLQKLTPGLPQKHRFMSRSAGDRHYFVRLVKELLLNILDETRGIW